MYYLFGFILIVTFFIFNLHRQNSIYYKSKKICKIYLSFKNSYKYKTPEEIFKLTTKEYFYTHSNSRYFDINSIVKSIFDDKHIYLNQENILDLIPILFIFENTWLEIEEKEPKYYSEEWFKMRNKKELDIKKAYSSVF